MIIDTIRNASVYTRLDRNLAKALDYLASTDFSGIDPGRHDLEGDEVFALVQVYETIPRHMAMWEAHRKYIDVQYMVSGEELVGYADLLSLDASAPYDAEKDCLVPSGEGSFFHAQPGIFLVLYPEDAHMPRVAVDRPLAVKKVVVKVRCTDHD